MATVRLTDPQRRMLQQAAETGEVYRPGANPGGAEQARMALVRKGLLRYDHDTRTWVVTPEGQELL